MAFPQLYGRAFFWTFLVVRVALFLLEGCAAGYYQRTPISREHPAPEAVGFYGCASFRQ